MSMERIEESILNKQRGGGSNALSIFNAQGSAGSNNPKLARILISLNFTLALLGWQDKPLANLPKFLADYQASLDAKYHNDFKDVLVAEEIERKRAERKGISILSQ